MYDASDFYQISFYLLLYLLNVGEVIIEDVIGKVLGVGYGTEI